MKPKTKEALDKSKVRLITQPNTVFFTTILFSLKHVADPDTPTMATDGVHLFVGEEFFMQLTEDERIGLLLHEILHVAFQHPARLKDRNQRIWNLAADVVVNNAILDAHYTLPEGAFVDRELKKLTTDEVYDLLKKRGSQLPDGVPMDLKLPKDPEKQAVETIRILQRAAIAAAGIGTLPGEIGILLEEATNPTIPWEILLQNYMLERARNEYHWSRPNRRFVPDFYLPALAGNTLQNVAIAVDTSGSVTDREFSHFITEITFILETLRPESLTILDFDTRIHRTRKTRCGENLFADTTFTGRGGTSVDCLFDWADAETPAFLIVLTDGHFFFPDRTPATEFLWVIHDNPEFVPLTGRVFHYKSPA